MGLPRDTRRRSATNSIYLRTRYESDGLLSAATRNALAHERIVHPDEVDWESHGKELFLDLNGLADDPSDRFRTRPSLEVGEEEAGEIGVQSLVARNELVGEGKARHQPSLLQPKDGRERACA